jgi:hypothetical protein
VLLRDAGRGGACGPLKGALARGREARGERLGAGDSGSRAREFARSRARLSHGGDTGGTPVLLCVARLRWVRGGDREFQNTNGVPSFSPGMAR